MVFGLFKPEAEYVLCTCLYNRVWTGPSEREPVSFIVFHTLLQHWESFYECDHRFFFFCIESSGSVFVVFI